jgi:hypothetical protein
MIPRRHARKTTLAICAAAFLCAAASASAQTVYKLVDAGGKITFTDRPDEARISQADVAPELDVARPPPRISGISSRRAAAAVDANEAARRLRAAQLKRKQGMEPLPGEQAKSGVANDRYWRRQEKLRLLVEQAQRRQRETGQPQLAAR